MNLINSYTDINQTDKNLNKGRISIKNNISNNHEYKSDILDIFADKVVNKNDINDMVTVPRSIFKGYLCFTVGTALNAISAMLKKGKFSRGISIFGSLISIYGTYNFVKPYLVREKQTRECNNEINKDLTKSQN